ncbi:unnamed protein product [Acanthoscelides obtectus]|uniref:Suppressor of cytokine signaling 6 n=1 Tax=Acanthoscelides obtectus TaxID=200917 RepID=A0A9P0M629_ACAOB|nr:unnamed protein product [Acanthoscelides obtectus]CAK1686580.1 Suppressor of cytokine signaling 6 [Acanthoscelides obtectus]
MENPGNNKESKNWLSQIRSLRIRSRSTSTSNKDERVMYQGEAPFFSSENNSNFTRSSSSIRRSIMKMHTRVKSVFRRRNSCRNAIISSNPAASDEDNVNTTFNFRSIDKSLSLQNDSPTVPALTPRNRTVPQLLGIQNGCAPKNEIANLTNYYWYWGPISRRQAEERLKDSPDGAFLVRDSNSARYLFSLSFRSTGRIMHTRINVTSSGYGLANQIGYNSVADLIEHAIEVSKNGVYCYTGTTTSNQLVPNFPVRLTLPVSRYDKVPTLKYLSRFVIRQCVIINDIEKLPLPNSLIDYLQEDGRYF